MGRLILSRHYQTVHNEWYTRKTQDSKRFTDTEPQDYHSPTVFGARQTAVLAQYLENIGFDPTNTLCVTSTLERSISTGRFVFNAWRAPLIGGENHFSFDTLNECSSGRNQMWSWRLEGRRTMKTLLPLMQYFPEKDIVAILHGNRNRHLLEFLDFPLEHFSNCATIELGLDTVRDSLKVLSSYVSYQDMCHFVERGKNDWEESYSSFT